MAEDFTLVEGKSEFNSSISVMNKMNYWFYLAEEAQKDSDYIMWYKYLVNCYLLLADDMKEDYDNKCKEFIKNLNDELVKHSNNRAARSISFEIHSKFIEFHKLLMKVFRDSGYKTKLKGDPYAAIR